MHSPLILIDGSSYFFRAFHALPPLTNSKGQPTGAIYGVANMVKKLIKDYQPEHIAVVFDAKGKTFRDALYPEYKAHRPPTPPDLSSQFQPLMDILAAMGLPLLIIDGVEADDVIGTLARAASDRGQEVVISTGDKDMAQLVNAHVSLINTMTNTRLDIAGVKAKFGVLPEQIIDYLALIGDSVDNVPGVSKCGPKTAVKWLEEYLTLDNLMQNCAAVSGKIGENLRASLAFLPLAKQLVTIKTDLDLPLTLSDLKPQSPDLDKLIQLTTELEFKTWLKELLGQTTLPDSGKTVVESPHLLISTQDQLKAWVKKLKHCSRFSLLVKTTDPEPLAGEIAGIALVIDKDNKAYIPLLHHDAAIQLSTREVLETLKPVLENPDIKKIGHDLKHDFHTFHNQGLTLQGLAFDVMLESYVLNSSGSRHDPESLALKYLGLKINDYETLAGKGAKQLAFVDIPIMQAAAWAVAMAETLGQLHEKLYPMLDASLQSVFNTIEMPLVEVLAAMEGCGVRIDAVVLAEQGERLKARILKLEEEAIALAAKPFNLLSPKQVQSILFEDLKIPVLSKTPTGQASTSEAVLQELAFDYRLPAVILEYRGLTKLVSTYIEALPKRINPQTQRVHTCYNQAVAATGRLSSRDPNLQNIPIRNEEGRLIRKAFTAPPGHFILAADYSQIELRIMAHLSRDPNLLKAFAMGWDIHAATASEIFQVPLEAVTHEQRRRSKAVNFGLIYGMSSFGLAKQLGISRADAQHYMDIYFERYPGVLHYMESTRQQAHQQGYVETLFGRRLYLPEINTKNMARQKAAERAAINAPMQGTAADIIKKSMLSIAQWQKTGETHTRMIMQVHDELVFEVAKEALESSKSAIRKLMETSVELSVPLLVSIGVGLNWDEAH